VDEFPAVSDSDLRKAFPVLARLGLPLMVHAEDPACLLPGRGSSRIAAVEGTKVEGGTLLLVIRPT